MKEKNTEKETKQKSGYGVRPPLISFEGSINAIKDVANIGGESSSRDAFVTIFDNSTASTNFLYKLSALKKFGLITFDKSSYEFTDLARRIVKPDSLADEQRAIYEAFCQHETLVKIWENYKGKLLPQRDYVANWIENNLKIPAEFKSTWADYFIEAAKFAQIIIERGESGSSQVLFEPQIQQSIVNEEKPKDAPKEEKIVEKPVNTLTAIIESEHWGILNQRKISGNRKAIFAIPDELSQEDIETLRVILKGIDAGLDGLKKYEQ
jgi:hypothetical protein